MNYFKTAISTLLLFILSLSLNAQQIEVSGKVLVYNKVPVVNADVQVSSSKEIVKTDQEGKFTCVCNVKDKLIVTAEGFIKYIIRVKKNKTDSLIGKMKLSSTPNAIDIAIKKGHILKIDDFKALAKKYSGVKDYSKYTTALDAIRNEFPTVQVSNGEIIIRGPSSINGSNAAHIEIDGVITTYSALSSLSPNNIATIRVIKGSDTAIYGVRGGTGVISITTKKE